MTDYRPAWEELHGHLSWMQNHPGLSGYLGQNFGKIATDLIRHAYPSLAVPGDPLSIKNRPALASAPAGDGVDKARTRITTPMIDAALDAEWATDAGGDVPAVGLGYSLRDALEEYGANLSTREIENAMSTALSAALNPPAGNEWAVTYDREGPR